MQNKFQLEGFEPNHLKNAKSILEKRIQKAEADMERNKSYQKEHLQVSLWQKLLNFFKS